MQMAPLDGSILNRRHVTIQWELETDLVRLELGNASLDFPFEDPIKSLVVSDTNTILLTEGLDWGQQYVWRVRDESQKKPGPWSQERLFDIKSLPDEINLEVSTFGGVSDGITVFNFCNYILGYGPDTTLIWFVEADNNLTDIVPTKDGSYLYVSNNQAFKVDIDGNVIWSSLASPSTRVHHAAIELPNGDVLALCRDRQTHVWNGESRSWLGDKIIRFESTSGNPVWTWSVFDHFSFEDVDEFASNPWNDWTHGNGLAFDEESNLLVASFRQISRLSGIDILTGENLWNIGFDLPSGDCPLGDNLFSFQHAPQFIGDNKILIFDNGNRRDHQSWLPNDPAAYSRAVELEFDDLRNPSVVNEGWSYNFSYCPSMGDADRLDNGLTLIAATRQNAIYEISSDGSLLKTWNLNQPTNCGSGAAPAYAAERIPYIEIPANIASCNGDLDLSGSVDSIDLLNLISYFGTSNESADLNEDSIVNIFDLLSLVSNFGDCED